jgi:hypothetical protein
VSRYALPGHRGVRLPAATKRLLFHMVRTGGWMRGDPGVREVRAVQVLRELQARGLVAIEGDDEVATFTPRGRAWATWNLGERPVAP